jgi:hypothetical protein
MGSVPATPADPAINDLYDPGTIDVADLASDAALRGTLRDNLDGSTPLVDDVTWTANGTYSIDITDLYNDWVTGDKANNGLVFAAPDEGMGSKFASFGNSGGTAPYLSDVYVPEPATMAMLGSGLIALVAARRRRRGRR